MLVVHHQPPPKTPFICFDIVNAFQITSFFGIEFRRALSCKLFFRCDKQSFQWKAVFNGTGQLESLNWHGPAGGKVISPRQLTYIILIVLWTKTLCFSDIILTFLQWKQAAIKHTQVLHNPSFLCLESMAQAAQDKGDTWLPLEWGR